MTVETIPEVPRDRWGRPLIVPPEGGKPVAYTRCTTFVSALEDTYNLERWKMRQTAIGLSLRPDLVAKVAAGREDKANVSEAVDTAMEAAGSHAAANTGMALHKITEDWDRGTLDPETVPPALRPDLDAYVAIMRQAKLTVNQIETFCVLDALRIGGTFDRTVTLGRRKYVLDVKTGSDVLKFGAGKIAMQLAVYANSMAYAPDGTRTELEVDPSRAIVLHLPARTGKAFLHWFDIGAGWQAVLLANQVRLWRARKDLAEPFEYVRVDQPDPIMAAIHAATTTDQLTSAWAMHARQWKPEHTEAARKRKAELS